MPNVMPNAHTKSVTVILLVAMRLEACGATLVMCSVQRCPFAIPSRIAGLTKNDSNCGCAAAASKPATAATQKIPVDSRMGWAADRTVDGHVRSRNRHQLIDVPRRA